MDRITLAAATELVHAARATAEELDLKMAFAVVDGGGHPILIARMDGARILAAQTVAHKALTAVFCERPTHLTVERSRIFPEVFLTLSAVTQPAMVMSMGGYPLRYSGRVVGGFASSGASGEQDMQASRAALTRWAEVGGDLTEADDL
jgi:uncharacterized protein GlcG (DUF336 family)